MKICNPKAVLFDLDGTLADSLEDLAASTNHVLKAAGYPEQPVAAFKYFAGDGIAKMIERALPQTAATPTQVEILKKDFMAYYAQHFADKTVCYPGLYALMQTLKEQAIKIAVVTNKAQPMAEEVVHRLYGNCFDVIMGMRDNIPAKPDPAAVFIVMRELGVTPSDCCFVGDTAMDIAAGINAGAFPIGVLWGFRPREELQAAGAKAFAANADELEQLLLCDKG